MDSDDEEIAIAAITAAGKIGGDTALEALIAKLNSNHADAATKALLSFNGKINNNIMKALDAGQSHSDCRTKSCFYTQYGRSDR